MMKNRLKNLLLDMDSSVDCGGWRQWLDDGGGKNAEFIINAIRLSKSELEIPKTLKLIDKILEALITQGLTTTTARRVCEMACYSCGGRKVLDDDISECPSCHGSGILMVGEIIKKNSFLIALTETYLKVKSKSREEDIINWCDRLNN